MKYSNALVSILYYDSGLFKNKIYKKHISINIQITTLRKKQACWFA